MIREKLVELRETLIMQANLVETMLNKCMHGLERGDARLLDEVTAKDEHEVNTIENRIDELCMSMLALFHPEAKDLRTVMMISKMTSDLERMGDCAVNISESARLLIGRPVIAPFADLPEMVRATVAMVGQSIASFIDEDVDAAKHVCENDEKVDSLRDKIWKELSSGICAEPGIIDRAFHVFRIANNLEKIADISTNIAEETIFIAKGIVIKHHKESV